MHQSSCWQNSWNTAASKNMFLIPFNSYPPGPNGHRFGRWHLNENDKIPIQISWKFVPRSQAANKSELVQVMAWCWTGNKPLPEPMMTQFIYAYIPLQGNELTHWPLGDAVVILNWSFSNSYQVQTSWTFPDHGWMLLDLTDHQSTLPLQSSNKPLSERALAQIANAIWRHIVTMG